MKIHLLVIALCAIFAANHANAAEKIQLKTEKDKFSYQKGYYAGNAFMRQQVDVDQKIFLKGVEDSLSGVKTLMTTTEMVRTEQNFQKERAAKKAEEQQKLADKNKKEGEAFLAANAKKEGVKILPSGLQYKVITEGKGKRPTATDKVRVTYLMTQIDGKVLDDSDKRTEHPPLMPVSGDKRYIPLGWTEAIQLMNEGSKWQIVMPSNLGFGDQGIGPSGPNAVLIFDVELVSIEKGEKTEKSEKTEKTEKAKKN